MYKIKNFNKIIKQICQENNIQYEELSDDWVIKLKKENKTKYIVGYKFDLNRQATAEICNDKYALYTVLKSENIPVIDYNILFKNEEEKLKKYYEQYGKDVVIKPNNGTCGNNVLHINDFGKLVDEYNRLMKKNHSVDICPFYDIESEYRIIYLPNKQYIYKKVKPIVTGDGIRTVKQLLEDFNYTYFSNEENLINEDIDIEYIPKYGEKVEYEWRYNLSRGAVIADVTESEKNDLINIAKRITEIINLNFTSIDIVKIKNSIYKVMEINSGVMMENLINLKKDGFEIAKGIYSEAIKLMFEI